MASEQNDHWSSQAYQHSASFVPKLATKIMQWLDPQKDDVILDLGCGDGVLNFQLAEVLSQGTGSIHGIDSSPSMIQTANAKAKELGMKNCTFEAMDANDLINKPELQKQQFTRAFSNAALHWILGSADNREAVFTGVRNALAPGSYFAFEMGGLGNVSELRAAMLMAVARRVGLEKARAADPWFFPDEIWVTQVLEEKVGGWKVERVEREWRPTTADEGGVDGWVRLMGQRFFEIVPEDEREECIRDAVDVLRIVCAKPGGGEMLSYIRLRVLAKKL